MFKRSITSDRWGSGFDRYDDAQLIGSKAHHHHRTSFCKTVAQCLSTVSEGRLFCIKYRTILEKGHLVLLLAQHIAPLAKFVLLFGERVKKRTLNTMTLQISHKSATQNVAVCNTLPPSGQTRGAIIAHTLRLSCCEHFARSCHALENRAS